MPKSAISLPDNLDTLKSLLVDQVARNAQLQSDTASLTDKNTQLLTENQHIKLQVLFLQERLNIALAQRYAASSEKLAPDQIRLFDEAEVEASADAAAIVPVTPVTIAEHTRQTRGRKPLPEHLPRIEMIQGRQRRGHRRTAARCRHMTKPRTHPCARGFTGNRGPLHVQHKQHSLSMLKLLDQ